MATGIQGPQGLKGGRGAEGATGWGAIGSETGPTGFTGPIGWFSLQATQSTTSLTLYGSNVSTLYKVTVAANEQIDLGLDSTLPVGGYFVFTNQTSSSVSLAVTSGNIDGSGSALTLAAGRAVMLIRISGNNLVSSRFYSGQGGLTGVVRSTSA